MFLDLGTMKSKKVEKACKEAQQTVIIKTIDVSVPGDTALSGLGLKE